VTPAVLRVANAPNATPPVFVHVTARWRLWSCSHSQRREIDIKRVRSGDRNRAARAREACYSGTRQDLSYGAALRDKRLQTRTTSVPAGVDAELRPDKKVLNGSLAASASVDASISTKPQSIFCIIESSRLRG